MEVLIGGLILVLVALTGAVIKLIVEIRAGRNPIEAAGVFLTDIQANRPLMERAEEGYQQQREAALGKALELAINLLGSSVPYIPGTLDDKLYALGRDIQTPGAPVTDGTDVNITVEASDQAA